MSDEQAERDYEAERRGLYVKALEAEIESLRSQLALLGGAAAAAVSIMKQRGIENGMVDVLKMTPYLRTLPLAVQMIEELEGERDD